MVEITSGGLAKEHFKLEPIHYARLALELTPRDSKARIIGVPQEYAPGMKLEPGEYLVEIKHPDYGTHRLYVVARSDQNIELRADLKAECGGIKIEPVQDGVTVYLDGQEVFKNKLNLKGLIPGPHKLQVWRTLYKPFTREVMVQPGKVQTVAIDLEQAEHFSNEFGMTFVKIPAGKFMMGYRDSPESEVEKNNPTTDLLEGYKNASAGVYAEFYPRHLVEISNSFFMQTTEVTELQWHTVMGLDERYRKKIKDKPMITDSIAKVRKFLITLNQRAKGKIRYRLPTEAEWEYACRAGTTSPFYTGETIRSDQAYYFWEAPPYAMGKKAKKEVGSGPYKVMQFSPNPWGLYDMHGNAVEICVDWFDAFFYTYSPIKDPVNRSNKSGLYAARGGEWTDMAKYLLSANRSIYSTLKEDMRERYSLRLVAERLAPPR